MFSAKFLQIYFNNFISKANCWLTCKRSYNNKKPGLVMKKNTGISIDIWRIDKNWSEFFNQTPFTLGPLGSLELKRTSTNQMKHSSATLTKSFCWHKCKKWMFRKLKIKISQFFLSKSSSADLIFNWTKKKHKKEEN